MGVFVTDETAGMLEEIELPAPEQPAKSIADKAIPPMAVRFRWNIFSFFLKKVGAKGYLLTMILTILFV